MSIPSPEVPVENVQVATSTPIEPEPTPGLDAVRARRAELRGTINLLEFTLAAPTSGREAVWTDTVHDALVTLVGDFAAHIEVTEGAGGLHQAILSGDLRLTNAVRALTHEHVALATEIASLVTDSDSVVPADRVAELRERTTRLLGHLIRHRQRGADLIYEAYATDIGGGD